MKSSKIKFQNVNKVYNDYIQFLIESKGELLGIILDIDANGFLQETNESSDFHKSICKRYRLFKESDYRKALYFADKLIKLPDDKT